jgi:Ca2+-dependent lipid-binding protein
MQEITGHRLSVSVIEAKDVKATNYFGGDSDCYAEFHVRDLIKKSTEVVFKSRCPRWEETHMLYGHQPLLRCFY